MAEVCRWWLARHVHIHGIGGATETHAIWGVERVGKHDFDIWRQDDAEKFIDGVCVSMGPICGLLPAAEEGGDGRALFNTAAISPRLHTQDLTRGLTIPIRTNSSD